MTKTLMQTGREVAEYLGGFDYIRIVEVNPYCASVAVVPTDEISGDARLDWNHAVQIVARKRGLRFRAGVVVSRVSA